MKLAIFGATGGTGTCLVEQAIAAGHEVTAVVRDPARLKAAGQQAAGHAGRLRIVTGDVTDPATIVPAVTGAGAVLTAIGPGGTGPATISADSARGIIEAMRKAGARRLLMVSGSIVTDAGEGPVMRYLVKPVARRTFLRNVCADMRRAEDEVRRSGLDWTIVRPPRLTAGAATGAYRTAADRNLPRGYTICRADLAACMLALAADAAAVHRHICVAR